MEFESNCAILCQFISRALRIICVRCRLERSDYASPCVPRSLAPGIAVHFGGLCRRAAARAVLRPQHSPVALHAQYYLWEVSAELWTIQVSQACRHTHFYSLEEKLKKDTLRYFHGTWLRTVLFQMDPNGSYRSCTGQLFLAIVGAASRRWKGISNIPMLDSQPWQSITFNFLSDSRTNSAFCFSFAGGSSWFEVFFLFGGWCDVMWCKAASPVKDRLTDVNGICMDLLNSVLESDVEKYRDVLPITSGFYWSISSWWDSRCRAQRKVEAMDVGYLRRTRWLGFRSLGQEGYILSDDAFFSSFGRYLGCFPGFSRRFVLQKIAPRQNMQMQHQSITHHNHHTCKSAKPAFFCSASRLGRRYLQIEAEELIRKLHLVQDMESGSLSRYARSKHDINWYKLKM